MVTVRVVAAVASIVTTMTPVITMTPVMAMMPVMAVTTSIVHSVNAVVVTMVVAETCGGVAISTVEVAIPRMGAL